MSVYVVKRGARYWDISERVEVGAHWTTSQTCACQFTDRTSARAVRDRYPNARIVRLVPRRKGTTVYLGPIMVAAREADAADKARAEEREAVAKWIDAEADDVGCPVVQRMYLRRLARSIRSGAHRGGK